MQGSLVYISVMNNHGAGEKTNKMNFIYISYIISLRLTEASYEVFYL